MLTWPFCHEPLDMTLFIIWHLTLTTVWYPSQSLGMRVSCPCHWCTDGMTLGQESDDLSRPWFYLLCRRRFWPTGAHGCILVLIWFLLSVTVYCYICISGDWWCVRYTSFTLSGSWSLQLIHEVTPHIICFLRGIPSGLLYDYSVMILSVISGLVMDFCISLNLVCALFLSHFFSFTLIPFLFFHFNSVSV